MSSQRKKFATQTMTINGGPCGGNIRTLPIYWPFTINLSYVNRVSIPAEESQYIYSHLLNAWELVDTIFTAT